MFTECISSFPTNPVVIRNKINNWNALKYSIKDWCDEFKKETLTFRQGDNKYREEPYWENLCDKIELRLEDFFTQSAQQEDKWLYFDYKYMKDIFPSDSKIFNNMDWKDLKLDNVQEQDSTLWIGNKGAHTPCHLDTYGCNYVAQIYGRKLWIIMPPEEVEVLEPTRVPYEESSIYSSFNFYTPNNNLLKIRKAYTVVLSPGDVLFIPRHWWHYVENLDIAISVNIWVPLDIDDDSRVEESLVRYYISNICQDLPEEEAKQLLNPNEFDLLAEPFSFTVLQTFLDNWQKLKKMKNCKKKFSNESIFNFKEELNEFDLATYVTEKSALFKYSVSSDVKLPGGLNNDLTLAKNLINIYCNPKNVTLMKKALLDRLLRV